RHALVPAGNVVPAVLIEHVGLDAAGGDGVASDALAAAVDGKGSCETLDGGFGTRIERMVGYAGHLRGDGRSEDDAAPLAAVLQPLLRNKELAAAIKVEDLVE